MNMTPQLPPFDHTPQPYTGPSADEVLALRKEFLNPAIFLYYKQPSHDRGGQGAVSLRRKGAALSRCVRRHRHGERRALSSARRRGGEEAERLLQHTTTIYLHPNIAEYAQALAAKMPGDLKVCYFVNSGSEANDLALLMARAYTGNYDVIALRNAYHGGNAAGMALTAHSTWKFNVPHSFGVHHAIAPDPYRGPYGHDDPEAGRKYAGDVKSVIDYATLGRSRGVHRGVDPGRRWLRSFFPTATCSHTYEHVRAAGGRVHRG